MCDTMKEGYSFYYISATGIYASCSPVGGDWLGYIGAHPKFLGGNYL